MEEKIFYPQAALSFDLQHFAYSTVELTDGKYDLTVGNYTVTCYFTGMGDTAQVDSSAGKVRVGNKEFTISAKKNGSEIYFNGTSSKISSIEIKGDAEISGTSTTFTVSSGTTATINGVDFKNNDSSSGTVAVGSKATAITLTGKFTVGDGTQNISLTINNVTYSGTGKIAIDNSGAVEISGVMTAKDNLNGKTYTTTGNDLDATFTIKSGAATEIDEITYEATKNSVVQISSETVTLTSGTITVGTGSETLSAKKFVVESAKATFKPKNGGDVTINGVQYTSNSAEGTIEFDKDKLTLGGKFTVKLSAGESVTLNDNTYTADVKDVTFTYDSDSNEVTFTGSLKLESSDDITVNGIAYAGSGDMEFTDSGITLNGDFEVSASEGESLSGKKFSTTSDVTFTLKGNENITLNDAKYTAGSDGLSLGYDNLNEGVDVVGEDVTIEGTGNFYVSSAVTVNGVKFESTDEESANLEFTATDTVKLGSSFTVGNGTTKIDGLKIDADSSIEGSTFKLGTDGEVTVGGVTYSGTGTVKVEDSSEITLSGSSITVGDGKDESLDGISYTIDGKCAANFNLTANDEVKIGDETYTADEGGTTNIDITSSGSKTFTFTISEGKTVSNGDIEYTAQGGDAEVTVKDSTINITKGAVAIAAEKLYEYLFKLVKDTTAQINNISFTKTSSSKVDSDIVFDKDDEKTVTLNSAFTIGDGTQKLGGLHVIMGTSAKSIFKLGADDSVIIKHYESGKSNDTVDGETTIEGVKYTGTGEVNVSGSSVTLSGTITGIDGDISGYNFTLSDGGTYTIGGTKIEVSGGSVSVGLDDDGTVKSVSGEATVSIDGETKVLDSTNSTWEKNSKGGWGEITYESFVLREGTIYGVDSDGNETAVDSETYSKSITYENGTLTSGSLTVEGGSITAGGKTYNVNGTAIFDGSSGLSSVSSGTVTRTLDNTETFTLDGITFTSDGSATFQYDSSTTDDTKLINGGGDSAAGTNYDKYTASEGAKLKAVGDSSGGYVTLNGTFTYVDDSTADQSFTHGDHTYQTSSATYSVTGNGSTKIDSLTGTVKTATGTRGLEANEAPTTAYKGNEYTITSATYTIEVTDGEGTENLTAGNATFTANTGAGFNYGEPATAYVATSNTTFSISFTGNNVTEGTKSGGGTRDAKSGETKDNYTLASGAKVLLQLPGGNESFYNGTATRSESGAFTLNSKNYNAYNGNATLTWTMNNGVDGGKSLTSGSATRTGTETSFTSGANYDADGNITYILDSSGEDIFAATGTRVAAGATTTYNGVDYTLADGATMRIVIANKTAGAETFYNGSATHVYDGDFTSNSTAYNGNATFTLSKTNGGTETLSMTGGSGTRTETGTFTSGNKGYNAEGNITYILEPSGESLHTANGTRTIGSNETITYDSYTLSSGAIMKIAVANKTAGAETFYSGSATRTATTFQVSSKDYTGNATYTLTKTADGTETESLTSGSGKRQDTTGTFTLNGNTYTDAQNVTYNLSSITADEELYNATGKRAYSGNVPYAGDTYTTNGTYTVTKTNGGTPTETLAATGTYSTSNGTFHYGGKEYNATQATTFIISYDGTTKTPTSASGAGTRVAAGETTTATDGTYTLAAGATKKITINGLSSSTESFYNGSATRTVNNGTGFKVTGNNTTYTASGNATLTLSKSNGGTEKISLTSGIGTRNAGTGNFTDNSKTYTSTGNITYYLNTNATTEALYAATGTRAFNSTNDAGKTTVNGTDGNTYTATGGTYTFKIAGGTGGSESFTSGTATYSTTSGSFVYDSKTYKATQATTLTVSYDGTNTTLTNASGAGTRVAANEDTTAAFDNQVYKLSSGATKKIEITGANSSTETFYNGSATRTVSSGNGFKVTGNDNTYTGAVTLTLSKTNGGAETVKLTSGTGTRTESKNFTYNTKTYTYTDEVTYHLNTNKTVEQLYAAKGTRSAQGDDFTGNWGNTYTLASGSTYSINIANGSGSDTVSSGKATNTYSSGSFIYSDGNTYTVKNNTTLSLSVSNGTGNESFDSGSGQNGDDYIIKKSSAVIGGATYSAAGNNVINAKASGSSAAIIGGLTYSGSGTLNVNDDGSVDTTSNFTAEGDFSAGKTLSSKTLTVTGDTDVKATFGSSGVTQLDKLSNGANVSSAAGATTAITDSNGSFTFDKTFNVSGDTNDSVTFKLNDAGEVTEISGLDRADDAYVTITVDGSTTLYARKTGEVLKRNADGTWSDNSVINTYVVNYGDDGFKVQAIDTSNTLIDLTQTDYSVDGTKLTLNETSKPVIVTNEKDTPIDIVGKLTGIENTNGKAIEIDKDGNFQLGERDAETGEFTPGISGGTKGEFKVDENGKFSVNSEGKIAVQPTGAGVVAVTAPTDAKIYAATAGTYKVNKTSRVKISNYTNNGNDVGVQLRFDSSGRVKGVTTNGACTFSIIKLSASSADLATSSDIIYSYENYEVNDGIVSVANNLGNPEFTVNDDGKITAANSLSKGAIVVFTGIAESSVTISAQGGNSTTIENYTAGTKIRYNSTADKWIAGMAAAIDGATYTVDIGADGKVILYAGGKQTKNVADYEKAMSGAKPDDDDADLPIYPTGGLNFTKQTTEVTLAAGTFNINSKEINVSGQTKLTLTWDGDTLKSLKATIYGGESITYSNVTYTAVGGSADVVLASGADGTTNVIDISNGDVKVTGNYNGKYFKSGKALYFDDVTITDLSAATLITKNPDGSFQIGDSNGLKVEGDAQFTVSTGSSPYVKGISNGAKLTNAKNYSVVTDSDGAFTVGGSKFNIGGDDMVTLKADSTNGNVEKIDGLGDNGTLTGDIHEVTSINDKGFSVSDSEKDLGIVGGNGKISKIYNLTGSNTLTKAAGASTISTDGNGGQFTFGSGTTAHTYSISSGVVDFLSKGTGEDPDINAIKNLSASASVIVYQSESNFQIGGNTVNITPPNSVNLTFALNGDTISGVEGFSGTGEIKGLQDGATVKVTTSEQVKINDKELKTSDTEYYAYARTGDGYGTITGIAAGTTFTNVKKTKIVPDAAGTYTFSTSNQTYYFDAAPTLETDSNSKVTMIGGVASGHKVVLYQNETSGLKIDNDVITLSGATSPDVTLTANGSGNISKVENLTGDIEGLTAGASVEVRADNTANSVKINKKDFAIAGDTVSVQATGDGYDLVWGIGDGANISDVQANVSLVTDKQGTYTLTSGHTYQIKGDDSVTFKTNSSKAIDAIDDVTSAQIIFYQSEAGIKINGHSVNIPTPKETGKAVTLSVDASGEITGMKGAVEANAKYTLQAGNTIEVDTSDSIVINSKNLKIDNNSAKYTVRAKSETEGYDLITGLKKDATVTNIETDVTVVTAQEGTYTFGGHKLYTDDEQITLRTGSSNEFTMVGGLDAGKSIALYQTEGGNSGGTTTSFNLNGNLITVAGAGTGANQQVTLTMGANNTVSTVKNLHGNIDGLAAGAIVEVQTDTAIAVNSDTGTTNLQISTDADSKVTLHTTADGYDSIWGLSNNAQVSTVLENVTLTTDDKGNTVSTTPNKIKFGNGTYTLSDKFVSFVTTINNSINAIYDLDGTVGGNFQEEIAVDGKAVSIGNDNEVSIVADDNNVIKRIYGVDGGATIKKSGGAETISTSGTDTGQFIFGDTAAHTVQIASNAGSTVNFLATSLQGYVPSITGMKGLGNSAQVTLYQSEENFTIENNVITFSSDTASSVSLQMGGDTIASVWGLDGEISGLSAGATVQAVDSDVTINGTAIQLMQSSNTNASTYTVQALTGGYDVIKGFGSTVTVKTAKNASLVTNNDTGTYTFGDGIDSQKFYISGDATVTIATDANSKVTAIDGFDSVNAELKIYQDSTFKLNNQATIALSKVATTSGSEVTFKLNDRGIIKNVESLKGWISGLTAGASVQVVSSDVKINGSTLSILDNDSDVTVISAGEGNGYSSIYGVSADATVSVAPSATLNLTMTAANTNNFAFGSDTDSTIHISGDSNVTVTTDYNTKLKTIAGLKGTLQSHEHYINVNGHDVFSTNSDVSIVASNSNELGIDSIFGVTDSDVISVNAGVYVQVTNKGGLSDKLTFNINGVQYNLMGDTDSISIADHTIKGLNADARITVGAAGLYRVNNTKIEAKAGDVIVGESRGAHKYSEGEFASFSPAEEIVIAVFDDTDSMVYATGTTEIAKGMAVVISDTSAKTVTVKDTVLAVVETTAKDASIKIAGKNDTIISAGTETSIDASYNANNALIIPTGGTMIIKGYDYSKGTKIKVTTSDIIGSVRDNVFKFGDNAGVSTLMANNATVTMESYGGETKDGIVNFYDLKGDVHKVAYAYGSDHIVNASGLGTDVVLVSSSWNADEKKSTLLGGTGNDTAFGGRCDYFNLGGGENYIELDSSKGGSAGATIAAEGGSTTVEGFLYNKDLGTGDFIKVNVPITEVKAGFTGSAVTLSYGDTTLDLEDIDSVKYSTKDKIAYTNIKVLDTLNNPQNVSIAKKGYAMQVLGKSGTDTFVKVYLGDNSGLDLSEFDSDTGTKPAVKINLSEGLATLGNEPQASLSGITSVKGGTGTHILYGSNKASNTLISGKGAAEIWGGGGNTDDLLIGNSDGQTAATTFVFGKASWDESEEDPREGNDTITNFQFDNANRSHPDSIYLMNTISDVEVKNSNVIIKHTNGSITIKDAAKDGNKFSLTSDLTGTMLVQFASVASYDGNSDRYYQALSSDATLSVTANATTSSTIYLGSNAAKNESIFGFNYLDAQNAPAGKILMGNGYNNTIHASNLGSTLMGNATTQPYATDDVLIGGSQADVFVFGTGSGNDKIKDFGASDVVYLYDINSDTVKEKINFTDSGEGNTKLVLGSGNTLTFDTPPAEVKYQLSGSTDTYTLSALKAKFSPASSGNNGGSGNEGEGNTGTEGGGTGNTGNGASGGGESGEPTTNTEPEGSTTEPNTSNGSSPDLIYDFWEINGGNELVDGENTFWDGLGESSDLVKDDEIKYLTDEICIGDVQFSVLSGEQLYAFNEIRNKD